MRTALLALMLGVVAPEGGCRRGTPAARPTSTRAQPTSSAGQLDGMGKAMLDPTRVDLMQPDALVARLHLAPEAVVADLGAGPGAFSHAFARALPRGKLIATDIKLTYLSRIEADARAAGTGNIETRRVAPDVSGLHEGEVDLVFLCQVDHYLRDREAYLRALVPALRPGGRVVIVNYLRERGTIEAIAARLGWREVDRWEPAMGFFARAYAAERR
jgi:tRNA A58 N-methylase Trm61